MRIVIRVDASKIIGSGHVMRCLTLAQRLRKKDASNEIYFVSRDLPGNLFSLIAEKKFPLMILPRHDENEFPNLEGYGKWLTVPQEIDANEMCAVLQKLSPVDRVVVDHYAIGYPWEIRIRPYTKEIFAIDDLENRVHDCDVLFNQNYGAETKTHYKEKKLVPEHCELRLGLKYVLLREEFLAAKEHLRQRDGQLKNILVFYGGSDPTNETMKALRAFFMLEGRSLTKNLVVNVVVGANNPHADEIRSYCERKHFLRYYCNINFMAELMSRADLMMCAGGSTTWERWFLGVPGLVTAIADNQIASSEEFGKQFFENGVVKYLGTYETVTSNLLAEELLNMMEHPEILQAAQQRCLDSWGK